MQLDLELGPDEVAIQNSVARFLERAVGVSDLERRGASFSRKLWRMYAEVGVLEATHPSYPNSAMTACVALEVLGAAAFPGPAPQALAAAAVLDDEIWSDVVTGDILVTFGAPPVVAWAAEADIVLLVENGRVYSTKGPADPQGTLAATRSGVSGAIGEDIGPAAGALSRYDVAVAAFVQAAGRRVLEAAAEHARTRRQFGRTLGEFQAVAFPLAEAFTSLNASRIITRFAAMAIDADRDDAAPLAIAARIAASRAALKASFCAHQTFGAGGQLVDGPVSWLSTTIQQYAAQCRDMRQLRAELPLEITGALDLDKWASR